MAVRHSKPTVGATATLLAGRDGGAGRTVKVSVPSGGQTVYLGSSAVTTTNGYPVAAGVSIDVALGSGDALYGIVAATTQATNVLETGA